MARVSQVGRLQGRGSWVRVRGQLVRVGAVAVASGVGLGLGLGLAAGAMGVAGAAAPRGGSGSSATPATLSGIQAKASADITQRVNALNAAIAKVNGAKGLGLGQGAL